MRYSEQFAQACFDCAAAPLHLRPMASQANGEHDFDILDADNNKTGILEVTVAIDSSHARTLDAVFHPKRGGERVPRVQSHTDWGVGLERGVNVQIVREHLDAYLARLEEDGIVEFRCPADWRAPSSVAAICEDLGVGFGSTMTSDSPGAHWLLAPGVSAFSNPAAVNEAISAEAAKADNLRKLSDETASSRHLFVCFDTSMLAAYTALIDEQLPDPVEVDASITHVWGAAFAGKRGAAVVWYAANGEPWTSQRCDLTGSKWDTMVTEQAHQPDAQAGGEQ